MCSGHLQLLLDGDSDTKFCQCHADGAGSLFTSGGSGPSPARGAMTALWLARRVEVAESYLVV
jgi:hypothetical protein